MTCARFRQAASARLDGEPLGMAASRLDHHLATCPDCARWVEQATRLTRQVRLGEAAVPDLTAAITGAVVLPAQRVNRRRTVLRVLLLGAALAQLAIAVPALGGDSLGMAMATHATHEAAAWNLALAAAFAMAALVPRRAAGLVPLLITFVLVLTALSIPDLLDHRVTGARLATHLAAVVGLVLVLALDRMERARPPRRWSGVARRGAASEPDATAAGDGSDDAGDGPDLRGIA